MRIVNATPDPDGFDSTVTLDTPTVTVSRGPIDLVVSLLGRVRQLPGVMLLRIATAGGPPIAVQALEIREVARVGEQAWAVVLVPEGVEPKRVLRDETGLSSEKED